MYFFNYKAVNHNIWTLNCDSVRHPQLIRTSKTSPDSVIPAGLQK